VLEKLRFLERFTKRIGNQKELLQVRKEIRREILGLNFLAAGENRKNDNDEFVHNILLHLIKEEQLSPKQLAVYEIFSAQLDSNRALTWDGFTHTWDIHPNQQSKIVLKEKGESAAIPIKDLVATLTWTDPVDLDLYAFYRTKSNNTQEKPKGFLGKMFVYFVPI